MQSLRKNITQLASGTLASQFLLFIITPMLTRLYSPEALGGLAIFMTSYTILAGISTLRYELSIPAQRNSSQAISLSAITFIFSIIFSVLLIITMFVFITLEIKWFPFYYLLLPFCVISIVIHNLTQQWSARKMNYSRYSLSLLLSSIINIALTLSLAYSELNNTESLVMGVFFGITAATFFMLIPRGNRNEIFGGINIIQTPSLMLDIIKKNKAFPTFMLPTFLLSSLSTSAPIFILGLLRTQAEVGFYSLALRFLQTPGIILGNAVSEALRAELFKRHHNKDKLLPIVNKLIKFSLIIGIPFIFLSNAIGDEVLILILGSNFEPASNLVSPLALMAWSTISLQPLQSLFVVLEKQFYGLLSQIALGLIPNITLILLCLLNLKLEKIILGYSIANTIITIGIMIFIRHITLINDRYKL